MTYVPHSLKPHDRLRWQDCMNKLAPVHGEEAKLKLIYQWVKQGHINTLIFRELVAVRR